MSLILSSRRAAVGESGRDAILTRLLSDAVEALGCDTERARASLFRAVALVGQATSSALNARQGGLTPGQAERAIALIDEDLGGHAPITQLAESVRLSQAQFSRAFRDFFGCSPKKFILERRIERALGMMLATDKRLCDIAQACGFSDQAHFSRMFRRTVGLTPNAWRRAQVSV